MLRTSNYLVLAQLPGDPQRFLAHHGVRGGYEVIPRAEAEFLLALRPPGAPLFGSWASEPRHGGDPPAPDDARLKALLERGYLTAWSEGDEERLFMSAVGRVHQKSVAAAMGYDFLVRYDGAPAGQGGPPASGPMATELIDRVCGSLGAFEAELGVKLGGDSPRRVGIVGGDPLVPRNRATLEYLVQRVRGLGSAVIWAETRGRELAELAALFGPHGIGKVSLLCTGAIDGGGLGAPDSLGALERVIGLLLERGADAMLKLNVTRESLELLPRFADLVEGNGWAGDPRFQLQLIASGGGPGAGLEEWELDQILGELGTRHAALRRLTAGEPIGIPAERTILDEELDTIAKLISDHRFHAYVFDPAGHIYSSTREAGDPRLRIGEVGDSGIALAGHLPLPRSAVHRTAEACRRCRYGIHCGWAREVRGLEGADRCDAFGASFRDAIAELCHLSAPGEPWEAQAGSRGRRAADPLPAGAAGAPTSHSQEAAPLP